MRVMADEEKGLSAAIDAGTESEETESSSEEEQEEETESFEEYESGADEAAGEPDPVKEGAEEVSQYFQSRSYRFN